MTSGADADDTDGLKGDGATLAREFAQARFHVDIGTERHDVRVGQPCPALEQVLAAGSFGYVTAWNPDATPRDTPANMQADDHLAARLAALGIEQVRMWSADAEGAHREAGWLLQDVEAARVDALGREFRQAGVLHWTRGEPVRLRMLRWRGACGQLPFVDWIE